MNKIDPYRGGPCPQCGEYAVSTYRHPNAPVICPNKHEWMRPCLAETKPINHEKPIKGNFEYRIDENKIITKSSEHGYQFTTKNGDDILIQKIDGVVGKTLIDEIEKLSIQAHLGCETMTCPTYYDGCHCTIETLIHNIDRAQKAERQCEAALETIELIKKILKTE